MFRQTKENNLILENSEKLTLEPRIVFDGAGAVTAVAENVDNNDGAQGDGGLAESDNAMTLPAALSDRDVSLDVSEIAFIDLRVPNAQELADSLRDNILVVFIDPAKDGLSQINQSLASFEQIETVHLLTHGDDGGFRLGSTLVTTDTIDQTAEGFSQWRDHLSDNADVLFYGCDLAENTTGQALLSEIGALTGADISASTDSTGAEALGGDWDLEYSVGTIESALAITEAGQSSYNSILAGVPEATVTGPSEDPLIGEQTTFTITFDNTSGTDAGYGPYINLFLPFLGEDGVYNAATDTYTSSADGISFVSATYLGASVDSTVITLEDIDAGTAGIQFEHPEAIDAAGDPLVVTLDAVLGLQEGDKLVLLTLPFGSYTADQPAANIEITVDVHGDADVGTGLDVITSAGFKFGNTPENDFDTDPSTQAATLNAGNTNSATITPQLFRVTTTLNASESESATGPNYPASYDIVVEVAAGQTLDDVDVEFILGEDMVYAGSSATGGGSPDITNLSQATGSDLSDDVLLVNFATLTGTQTVTLDFYVDEFDQDGNDVLDPLTGAAQNIGENNNVDVTYDWDTTDARDADLVDSSVTSTAPQITAKSIATQKSVVIQNDTGSAGATPGDTLEYTIQIQISDFFAYDAIAAQDIFDDGMLLDGTFTPTLTISRQGTGEGPYNFATNFLDTTLGNDDHQLDFDISGLLTTNAVSDILEGGKFGADDLGGTTATITYRTIIQDEYDSGAGNLFIKQGDTLSNNVGVQARLLDGALAPIAGPVMVTDDSGASVTVPTNQVSLSIYALNGSTAGTLTDLTPGDDVTFRLEYDLITGDLEDFFLDAYLPLPIFNLADINDDGAAGENFILDNGVAIPTVGDFRYGPTATGDITGGIPNPAVTRDVTSNFVRFNLGDLSDPANDGGKIDILFTIRVTDDPFADGLTLSALVQQSDDNSPSATTITNDLGQMVLQQPEINGITKGVVSTDNASGTYAGGNPSGIKAAGVGDANPLTGLISSANLDSLNLDSDLSGVDEGDLVRFAIVIENTGSSPNGAFDLTISDTMPAGFKTPAGGINLRAVTGSGTLIAFEGGSPETDLFAGGAILVDGATGALGEDHPTSGDNIIILTYDLEVDNLIEAAADLTNTATLSNFSNTEGGDDFTAVDLTDTAMVTIAGAGIDKTLTSTDQAHTAGNNVVVGEVVQYTVLVTIPEGLSSSATFVDTLDAGMAFVGIDSITFSSGDITSTNGTAANILANDVSFSNVGGGADNDARRATIDFGDITNANTTNATDEVITVIYSAVIVNTASTDGGAALNNTASWSTTNNSVNDNAADVTVVEPQVTVSVTPDVTQVDTGDTITWTVTLTAPAGNDADAFDVNFDNIIPAGLTYVGGSLSHDAGVAPTAQTENGGDFNATFASLTPGQTTTFTFQTTVDNGAAIADSLDNSGTATWHSISGGLGDPSTHTTADTERTGAGGINDYTDTDTGTVSIMFQAPELTLEDTSETATAGDDVVPGEIVRYRFKMRVPESTTSDFRVEPEIPPGLQFLNDGTVTIAFISDGGLSADGAGLAGNGLVAGNEGTVDAVDPSFVIPAGLITGGPFSDGDNPQFQLGELTNIDDDANQEFVIIEFNALVLNTATTDDGDTLTTDVDVLSNATNLATTNGVDVDVEEPVLTNLDKQVIDTDGTTATFQITFENTSGVDAFDVNIADLLPANLANLQNVTITPAGGVAGVTDNSVGAGLDIDITDFPTGGSITITYTADVIDSTAVVADSDVDVTWTSIDGATSSLTTVAGVSTSGVAGTPTGERVGGIAPAQNDYLISEGAGLNVISGTLFDDANDNGAIDGGEARVSNVQINAVFAGEDGIFGNGDDVTLSTMTDASGDYSFGALPSGDYRVSVQPNGQPNGLPANYAHLYDPTGAPADNLIERTLGEGVTNANNNFGLEDAEPPLGSDKTFNIAEDATITFAEADFGFSDPNPGDTFDNVRIDTLPAASEGVLQLGGVDVTPGQVIPVAQIPNLVFTPAEDANGTPLTAFTFSVQDDTGRFDTVPNTFTVNVAPVSDAPEGTDKSFTMEKDDSLTFAPADFGFSDVDGDAFDNVRIDTLPANGTLELGGVAVVPGQIIPVAQIANLVFTPNAGEVGVNYADFTFSVQDDTGDFDVVPNTFEISVEEPDDVGVSNPPDATPIPGTGTVPGGSAGGFDGGFSGGEGDPVVDPFSGIRVFGGGFNGFSDINFEIDSSRPDFWIAGTVDQKLMIETKEMAFQVPKTIFRHSNSGEPLSFEAELSDGSPLPDWLVFDSGDLSFKGTPPEGAPKVLEIVIIARDTKNNEVKAPVRVLINREVDDVEGQDVVPEEGAESDESLLENAPEEGNVPEGQRDSFLNPHSESGRLSFSEQLSQQSRQAQILQQQESIKFLSS